LIRGSLRGSAPILCAAPISFNRISASSITDQIPQPHTRQLNNLDSIHALAKQNNIVTRYSSLLVLINDRQKEALKKAEFSEKSKPANTPPIAPFAVPSVLEPQEWALLIIAGLLLGTAVIRRFSDRREVDVKSL